MKEKVLVTGGSGMVGSALEKIKSSYKNHDFFLISSKEYLR